MTIPASKFKQDKPTAALFAVVRMLLGLVAAALAGWARGEGLGGLIERMLAGAEAKAEEAPWRMACQMTGREDLLDAPPELRAAIMRAEHALLLEDWEHLCARRAADLAKPDSDALALVHRLAAATHSPFIAQLSQPRSPRRREPPARGPPAPQPFPTPLA